MYKSFKIKWFRGFKEIEVENIQRVNLIAGLNNVGKTALLEAIFLHCGALNPDMANQLNAIRGIKVAGIKLRQVADVFWTQLFFNLDPFSQVEIEGTDDKEQKRWLRLKIVPQGSRLIKIGPEAQDTEERSDSSVHEALELEYQDKERTQRYQLIFDSLQRVARIEPIPPPPPFPACFLTTRKSTLSEDAEQYGNLEVEGQQDILLEILKIIEPRLKRLAVITRAGIPMIHGDIGIGRLLPLPLMGEGMVRICSLVLTIANIPNGVVLIDEIENGLHHSVMGKLWKAVGDIARRFNAQIFATTHSYECLVAAHRAFSESTYDFCLHRLENIKGKIKVIAYDQERLESTIENGWEIR